MTNRIDWIDSARAIGITFVVLGHAPIPDWLKLYVYSFHMPLFFFLSGIFFDQSKIFKDFFQNKCRRLLVPYAAFGLLSYVFWYFIKDFSKSASEISPLKPLFAMFYGSNCNDNWLSHNILLWFLPCLFCCSLFFFFIARLKSKIQISLTLFILSMVGSFLVHYLPVRLPWGSDIAITAVVFFGAGYLSKDYIFNKLGSENNILWIIGLSLVLNILFCLFNIRVDMNNAVFGNYLCFYIAAFSGIIFWLYISFLMPSFSLIKYIGQNSLLIFLFQYNIYEVVTGFSTKILNYPITPVLSKLALINPDANPLFVALIYTIAPFILSFPVIKIINSHFPFIIGKNSSFKNGLG